MKVSDLQEFDLIKMDNKRWIVSEIYEDHVKLRFHLKDRYREKVLSDMNKEVDLILRLIK